LFLCCLCRVVVHILVFGYDVFSLHIFCILVRCSLVDVFLKTKAYIT
jgi:hypothetical protein